jgi:ribonuclease HI
MAEAHRGFPRKRPEALLSAFGIHVLYERGARIAARAYPLGILTNNAAEYAGLIRGLELARQSGARRLEVRSDSELMVRQMQGAYRTRARHLKDAALRARELMKSFAEVRFTPIPREENREADRLANQAMDEAEAVPPAAGKERA